jgi:hypothetical protein
VRSQALSLSLSLSHSEQLAQPYSCHPPPLRPADLWAGRAGSATSVSLGSFLRPSGLKVRGQVHTGAPAGMEGNSGFSEASWCSAPGGPTAIRDFRGCCHPQDTWPACRGDASAAQWAARLLPFVLPRRSWLSPESTGLPAARPPRGHCDKLLAAPQGAGLNSHAHPCWWQGTEPPVPTAPLSCPQWPLSPLTDWQGLTSDTSAPTCPLGSRWVLSPARGPRSP